MKYQLNTQMTDEDYYKFNLFVNFRSYYGKKQLTKSVTMVGIIFLLFTAIVLIINGFTQMSFVRIAVIGVAMVLWIVLSPLLLKLMLKARIRSMRKKGRLGYSPVAVIEFYDDCFVETTEQNKTENKYSAVDRISILKDEGIIYIHMGALIAHIIPFSTFENMAQFNEFSEFIKTKCKSVDIFI